MSDIRILGVEADVADKIPDGQHLYHWVDANTINSTPDIPVATTSAALQVSYNGSNTGALGMVGTGKSILIGANFSGGIGAAPSDDNPYRARAYPSFRSI